MARVTKEDCITSIPHRFQLVIYACNRARDLSSGSQAEVPNDNDKNTVIALREIAEKKIDLVKTWDSIVVSSQRYQPVEDTDIDDNETVPMNENASEKKRKKIYMTQNEIQKLISQKKSISEEEDQTDNPEDDLEKQED